MYMQLSSVYAVMYKLCICSYYYICISLQLVPYITFGNSDYTVGENDTLHVNITLSHASVFDMTVTVYATTVNATGKLYNK